MNPRKVIIVGGFSEIIELCEDNNIEIIGVFDNKNETKYPYLGTDNEALSLFSKYSKIPIIISPDLPSLRKKLYDFYSNIGYIFAKIVSKDAYVSKSSKIEDGTIIQRGVTVSSNVVVKSFVKLNVNSTIMHDSIIENFTTVAPGAMILGKVNIHEFVYIGSNSVILPSISVLENAIVGAGAVVTKNVLAKSIVKGIPAK